MELNRVMAGAMDLQNLQWKSVEQAKIFLLFLVPQNVENTMVSALNQRKFSTALARQQALITSVYLVCMGYIVTLRLANYKSSD